MPKIAPAAKKSGRGEELANGPCVEGVAPGEAPQPLTLNHPALNPGRDKRPGFPLLRSVRVLFRGDHQVVAMHHLGATAEAQNGRNVG